ncbi:MAG: hypothetical protein ACI9AH_001294, partial [Oceanospirillaceae bacterium]
MLNCIVLHQNLNALIDFLQDECCTDARIQLAKSTK